MSFRKISLILILVTGTVFTTPCLSQEYAGIVAQPPTPFPNLKYKDGQDQEHILENDLGKLTIVHFWATWCGPCAFELPTLDKTQEKYKTQGLNVISISEDHSNKVQIINDFFVENAITSLPAYLDSQLNGIHATGARGLPTSYFLDENGQEIGVASGMVDWESAEVRAFITAHLKSISK